MSNHYPPIGTLKTCFAEKFGAPRQPLLVPEARGILKLLPNPNFHAALHQLETFSHIWIIFVFHQHTKMAWRPLIEPPRVEGPEKVGVFASRSPHRPNPIGMSAVKLDRIDFNAPGGIEIHISGVDILDETPVLDIKPYLPYADQIPDASSGWANGEISRFPVSFSPESLSALSAHSAPSDYKTLVEQVLAIDPRPSSQKRTMPIKHPETEGKIFRFRLGDFDVHWQVQNQGIHVLNFLPL